LPPWAQACRGGSTPRFSKFYYFRAKNLHHADMKKISLFPQQQAKPPGAAAAKKQAHLTNFFKPTTVRL